MAGNRFPRVSRHGHRGDQEGNGRKWLKMAKKDFRGYMVGNGFPRVSRRGHRGDQAGNGRKWLKMVEKGFPRLYGRKWISAYFTSFPYYLQLLLLLLLLLLLQLSFSPYHLFF